MHFLTKSMKNIGINSLKILFLDKFNDFLEVN
jgi:hypothetical protein